jgi:hypothetical protein
MKIKIENNSNRLTLPARTEENIDKILKALPREHILGIDRIRFVDSIQDPRLRSTQKRFSPLPGLYHPKQGSQLAWIEISLDVLLPVGSLRKRFIPRITFKANLATVLFSLVGQHHFLTMRHSIKKGNLESSVKEYTEKNIKKWNEKEHSFRARLFKPFQPILERWAKNLQRRAKKDNK